MATRLSGGIMCGCGAGVPPFVHFVETEQVLALPWAPHALGVIVFHQHLCVVGCLSKPIWGSAVKVQTTSSDFRHALSLCGGSKSRPAAGHWNMNNWFAAIVMDLAV